MTEYVRSEPVIASNRHVKILLHLEKWDRAFAIGFLGGLIDSDGSFVPSRSNGHYGACITTSSTSLRDELQILCTGLGLTTSVRVDYRGFPEVRPRYTVYIKSDSMKTICSEILSSKHQRFHGGPGRT